jgi:16S rRNA (guanine(1405)-N(7))-methyltransferase
VIVTERDGRGEVAGDPAVLDAVAARIAAAPKYRAVHPDTIRSVVGDEVVRGGRPAELERRARARLHRVAALYLASTPASRLRARLRAESTAPGFDLRRWCRAALAEHVSTAERLDDLEELYPTILGLTGAPTALADVACAHNVLALPWLRDHSAAPYLGYDLNADVVALGRDVLALAGGPGEVVHLDALVTPEAVGGDVALLLKTFHCIEARRTGAGLRLLEDLTARTVVVSLPRRGGGGRAYGFAAGHGARIEALAEEGGWTIATAGLAGEEIWAITKPVPTLASTHDGG